MIPRHQPKQRRIPEKESSRVFIPNGDTFWHQKETNYRVPAGQFICRDNFYLVYNFYVDNTWRQMKIIPKCQWESFAPAG